MLSEIIQAVVDFIVGIISDMGYIGVVMLMAVESAAIPLPSEIIMPFAGYLTFLNRFTLLGAAMAGALGSVIGSWVIYWLAYKGGRPLVEKYGRYVLISPADLERTDRFFQKFGGWATFIGRMLPIVRTYITIPAGIAKASFWPFTLAAFVGSFIWSYFLAYLGFKLGQYWQTLHDHFRGFDIAIAVLIAVGFIWYVWRHFRQSRNLKYQK